MRVAIVGYPMLAKRQWRLCTQFPSHDIEPHLVVPSHWPGIPKADYPPSNVPFPVHELRSIFTGKMGRYFLPTLPRTLARIDPDVTLTHGEPWFAGTAYVQAACDLLGIQHAIFSWENLERVPNLQIQRQIEAVVLNRASGVLCGSQAAEQRVLSRGFEGSTATAPQSGVDTNMFSPASPESEIGERFDVAQSSKVVTYTGRLTDEKGLETLLDTVSDIRDRISNITYLIIGSGGLDSTLESRINEEGLEDTVTLVTERQPYELMPDIYRLSDVFVYPSVTQPDWAEQFGYSVAEAMSTGVPPVVSECGSLPSVVGDAGIVCPEEDATALSRAIGDLLLNDERRQSLGEQARKRVVEYFSLEKVASDQASFLRRVASTDT